MPGGGVMDDMLMTALLMVPMAGLVVCAVYLFKWW